MIEWKGHELCQNRYWMRSDWDNGISNPKKSLRRNTIRLRRCRAHRQKSASLPPALKTAFHSGTLAIDDPSMIRTKPLNSDPVDICPDTTNRSPVFYRTPVLCRTSGPALIPTKQRTLTPRSCGCWTPCERSHGQI